MYFFKKKCYSEYDFCSRIERKKYDNFQFLMLFVFFYIIPTLTQIILFVNNE